MDSIKVADGKAKTVVHRFFFLIHSLVLPRASHCIGIGGDASPYAAAQSHSPIQKTHNFFLCSFARGCCCYSCIRLNNYRFRYSYQCSVLVLLFQFHFEESISINCIMRACMGLPLSNPPTENNKTYFIHSTECRGKKRFFFDLEKIL